MAGFDMEDFGEQYNHMDVAKRSWMEHKNFVLVTDVDQLKKIVDEAIKAGHCALDLETTGLDNRIVEGDTVHDIVGYCLSYDGETGYYVPVFHQRPESASRDTIEKRLYDTNCPNRHTDVPREIKRLVDNCVTIYHNGMFDHEFLYGVGIDVDDPDQYEDTMILAYLKDSSDKRISLKRLSDEFLDMEMIELHELFDPSAKDYDFSTLNPNDDAVLWYAGSDAICTYLLWKEFRKYGFEQEAVYKVEKACVPSIRWMERNRPKLDRGYVKSLLKEIQELRRACVEDIEQFIKRTLELDMTTVRENYDPESPQKLGNAIERMVDEMGLDIELEKTEKTKQVKTTNDVIEKLASEHGDEMPFLQKVATFRSLQKVEGTYVRPLSENMRKEDDTIRFSFNPHRVDTGRFAASKGRPEHGYSGINVQSTPACYNSASVPAKRIKDRPDGVGDEEAELVPEFERAVREQDFLKHVKDGHFILDNHTQEEWCIRDGCEGCPFLEECDHEDPISRRFLSLDSAVRRSLVARDDYVICAIDYSGLELRTAANLSKEPKWIEEFNEGSGDLHSLTARAIYGEDVTDKPDFKMYRQQAKCVVGDTLVQTDRGLIPIRDLDPGTPEDEFVAFDEPIQVRTDEGTAEATHFYNGGVQKTVRIETNSRFSLEGSRTHRIRIFDEEEGYTWREMGDLQEGDWVVLDRGEPLHEDVPSTCSIDPFYHDLRADEENRAFVPATEDWCYLMGVVTGDGHRSKSQVRITWDAREQEWGDMFASVLERLGLRYRRDDDATHGNKAVFAIGSRRLSRTMGKWGVKKLSRTAEIPPPVLRTGVSGQVAFLQGLFDTDGTIDEDGAVSLSSSSEDLLRQVRVMCASLGVFGRTRIAHADHPLTGRDYYRLVIGGAEAGEFAEKIGFRMERKRSRLRLGGECRDKIPYPSSVVATSAPKPLRRTRKREGLTYNMIDRFREDFDFSERILWLRDRGVRIERVSSVETGEANVYDLSVPGPESFWADGFINHNSANFAILFGGGGSAVARATNVSNRRGQKIRDQMLDAVPKLRDWFDQTIKEARRDKEVSTRMGRKIRLPDIDHSEGWIRSKAERNAINGKVQGTATGDLIKFSMAAVYRWLKREELLDACRMILTIHDELVFEIRKDKLDELIPTIVDKMTVLGEKWGWPVSLECDVEIGETWDVDWDWGKMHTVDPETGRAKQRVPEFLLGDIEMKPGMWYEDDGEIIVIEGDDSEIDDEDAADEVVGVYPADEHPVFKYEATHDLGSQDLDAYFLRLKRILDWLESGSHVLRVLDHDGNDMIPWQDEPVLVDPVRFETLARYVGV